MLLQGRTRSEIARELFVSGDTVKTHIRNLYRKTGVAGKDQLVEALGARG
ncbi:helix-turn-helix transcriptional regulator [Eggerthella sinensis]|nr:helix-turn-helix transcriptional regulator [Eggerthella sinensis]